MLQKEREEHIRRDHEEEVELVKQTMKLYVEEDESYLKYADEITEDAINKGRYLYPILHAREVTMKLNTETQKCASVSTVFQASLKGL